MTRLLLLARAAATVLLVTSGPVSNAVYGFPAGSRRDRDEIKRTKKENMREGGSAAEG
jgi:hypothetical protein